MFAEWEMNLLLRSLPRTLHMKKLLKNILFRRITDCLLSPVTLFAAVWFKYIRTGNSRQMPWSEKIFRTVGVLPVNDHYYQPLVNPTKHLQQPLDQERNLTGIKWNMPEQLALLDLFHYPDELAAIPFEKKDAGEHEYYYNNNSFAAGDGEYLYSIIRHFKPRRVIEIGCGYSTLVALRAEQENAKENAAKQCMHICIEPYEMPWLEKMPVEVLRQKVELVDRSFFTTLEANDILFIDSSHIIRPQGDVLFEFLEVLPLLKPGVLVHVHDIFSPRDYPAGWIIEEHRLWNEQYLLEAFLTCNDQFRILGALNFLKHHYPDKFHRACPHSAALKEDEPGSFWIIKN